MSELIPAGFCALPLPLAQLSLAAVLKCGQSFRWSIFPLPSPPSAAINYSPTHEYRLCLRDRVVCLRQSPDVLFYRSIFPEASSLPVESASKDTETLLWLNDYFQLDVDLVELYDQWSDRDAVFRALRSRFSGIRMLRQDPWENLVSFICSSNNNISRITKMIHSLCKHYSPSLLSLPDPQTQLSLDPSVSVIEQTYHPFPPPSVLAQPDVAPTLRSLGFGYRAEFIQRTAKMLVDEHGSSITPGAPGEASEIWLKSLRDLNTADAREELLRFVGVGRKVADCILLMSLDKRDVIPVDTHVYQIAVKHYGLRSKTSGKTTVTPKLYEELASKLATVWGNYAGWAHSVLFTADLKSFSTHGLTSSSTELVKSKLSMDAEKVLLTTSALIPSQSPHKRKAKLEEDLQSTACELLPVVTDNASGIPIAVDRVKRRRR